MSADLEALTALGLTKRCECAPRRGDHDYGLGHAIAGCNLCFGTGAMPDWPAIIAALERAEQVEAAGIEWLRELDENWGCGGAIEDEEPPKLAAFRAALAATPDGVWTEQLLAEARTRAAALNVKVEDADAPWAAAPGEEGKG